MHDHVLLFSARTAAVIASGLLLWAALGCGSDPPLRLVTLTVTPDPGAAASPSGTVQFSANGTYNDGSTAQNLFAGWMTSNTNIATIDASGKATCLAAGQVTITATTSVGPDYTPGTPALISDTATLNCS